MDALVLALGVVMVVGTVGLIALCHGLSEPRDRQ
jgi:hypothetical protein